MVEGGVLENYSPPGPAARLLTATERSRHWQWSPLSAQFHVIVRTQLRKSSQTARQLPRSRSVVVGSGGLIGHRATRAFGARCDLARIPPSPPNLDPLF